MKKVLVTNDDGINASGLMSLVDSLSKTCEVYVVAPAEQQSAKSMAITFLREVGIVKTEVKGAVEAYIIDGTPVDCVRWAIEWFEELGITFDYLFSGINLGANVGIAAYYSGTIGAAREGALCGVRSIALSVGTHLSTHFSYICSLVPRLMEMADSLSLQTILSVNAPDLPPWEVRGLRIAEVAPHGYAEKYSFAPAGSDLEKSADEISWEDTVSFQLGQVILDGKGTAGQSSLIGPGMTSLRGGMLTDEDLRFDLDCMRYGFAAITPLSCGVSDDVALRKLQGRYSSDDVIAVFVDPQELEEILLHARSPVLGLVEFLYKFHNFLLATVDFGVEAVVGGFKSVVLIQKVREFGLDLIALVGGFGVYHDNLVLLL